MKKMGESDANVIEKETEDLGDKNHEFKTGSQPLPFYWTFFYALLILSLSQWFLIYFLFK